MGPSLGLFMEEESCPICFTISCVFCFFCVFLGRGGGSLCEPFGALLWGRGGVMGKRDWSFELWVGLCVFFGGFMEGFSSEFSIVILCERAIMCTILVSLLLFSIVLV